MATAEMDFLHSQLEERKRRLETVITHTPEDANLEALLREVDAALARFAAGTYGLCETCHDTVERDRLLADPLIRYCLDHLTKHQRDLDLASELQRGLLPPADLKVDGWETSYHYAPLGPVSGDYCDLYPCDGQLFFMLGDVSGKGVAASMRMTQLHALFRSLIGMGLPLAEIVEHINRFLCDSGLAGQYATLVCGRAKAGAGVELGSIELFNAGHLPVVAVQRGSVRLLESTGFPLGMFREASYTSACLQLCGNDMIFLYTDGLSEARGESGEYGIDRVTNLVGRQTSCCPAGVISACIEDLRGFAGANPGMDDVTLLAIQHAAQTGVTSKN